MSSERTLQQIIWGLFMEFQIWGFLQKYLHLNVSRARKARNNAAESLLIPLKKPFVLMHSISFSVDVCDKRFLQFTKDF